MLTWSLDPQLARDTVALGDLPLSRVLLMNDANYPWLILVPRRPALVEIIDLEENEQVQLMAEVARAAQVLKAATACDKLNIAAIGNVVAQLHVHIVARRRGDTAWPLMGSLGTLSTTSVAKRRSGNDDRGAGRHCRYEGRHTSCA